MSDKIFVSDKYRVSVSENSVEMVLPVYISLLADGTENNIKLPEEVAQVYDGLGQGTRSVKTYYSSFEFENSAKVCVALPPGTAEISVKPEKFSKLVRFENDRAIFEVNETTCMSIEPDGDIFGALHIFCNKKEDCTYNLNEFEAQGYKIIKFIDGVYNSDNCDLIQIDVHGTPVINNLRDNTIIYIGTNAIVNAAIELKGVKNVKILGTGTISLIDRCHGAGESFKADRYWGAFRYYAKPNILIRSGCQNIEIEGVLLNCEFRGIVLRNSEDIVIKNVKMFTATENADGINCYNISNLLVDGCYIQSADDCFCMYNSCDSIPTLFDEGYDNVKSVCRNVEVKNCVMSSNARPFVLGGHATGSIDPRCLIEDVYIHDCEVVGTPYRIFGNTEEYAMRWSGFMRILSQSEQVIRNILFENITINVTKGHNGKIFHIEVRDQKEASYNESKGYMIEGLTFKNINISGETEKLVKSVIRCREHIDENDTPTIRNIKFENVFRKGCGFDMDQILAEGPIEKISIV